MKSMAHYQKMFREYSRVSSARFADHWMPQLAATDDLLKVVMNKNRVLRYHTILGYIALSGADLFQREIKMTTALEVSDLWFSLGMIDHVVDERLGKDPPAFLDDCCNTILGKNALDKHDGVERDVLEILARRQPITSPAVACTLIALKDSVVEEQRVKSFRQYMANAAEGGRLSGRLIYDIVADEEKFSDPNMREFFDRLGKAGNFCDNFKDFKKDQATTSPHFSRLQQIEMGLHAIGATTRLFTTRGINPLLLSYSFAVYVSVKYKQKYSKI